MTFLHSVRSGWRVALLLGFFALEVGAQSPPRSSWRQAYRIAVVEVPAARIDSLTLQAAAQLRQRLARSTPKDALRVTPKSDVDGTFTLESPGTLSGRDYAGIGQLTLSTVLTVTAFREPDAVRIRSSLYTARDSIGQVMADATGHTTSEAVDQLARQLEGMPRTRLFPAP